MSTKRKQAKENGTYIFMAAVTPVASCVYTFFHGVQVSRRVPKGKESGRRAARAATLRHHARTVTTSAEGAPAYAGTLVSGERERELAREKASREGGERGSGKVVTYGIVWMPAVVLEWKEAMKHVYMCTT